MAVDGSSLGAGCYLPWCAPPKSYTDANESLTPAPAPWVRNVPCFGTEYTSGMKPETHTCVHADTHAEHTHTSDGMLALLPGRDQGHCSVCHPEAAGPPRCRPQCLDRPLPLPECSWEHGGGWGLIWQRAGLAQGGEALTNSGLGGCPSELGRPRSGVGTCTGNQQPSPTGLGEGTSVTLQSPGDHSTVSRTPGTARQAGGGPSFPEGEADGGTGGSQNPARTD